MYPSNEAPKQFRNGSTAKLPSGSRVGPISDGLAVEDGWVFSNIADLAAVPSDKESVGRELNYANGKPQFEHTLNDITAEMVAARRKDAVKAECEERILSMIDRNTQATITGLASTNLLTSTEASTWRAGMSWVLDMLEASRTLSTNTEDFTSNTVWPAVPAGMPELAAKY
jgi:squalene cyclase